MNLINIFYKLFIINIFTFGGGYSIIPVINDEFVKSNLISEEEMSEYISISQTIPGVMVVNLSFLIGKRLKGYIGAFTAVFASILPSFIIITIITFFYKSFIQNEIVKTYLTNILPTVSAILFMTGINMMKKSYRNSPLAFVIIFIFSLYSKVVLNLPFILILIVSSIVYLLLSKGETNE